MQDICDYLKSKTYPGRGIVAFKPANQNKLFLAYWIMGRSENSRNRVFDVQDNVVRAIPADESKVEDPHLIIYNARISQRDKNVVVITNGDQTDTIADCIKRTDDVKVAFMQALATRTFEDDKPNFTPRISLFANTQTGEVAFSIIKCTDVKTQSAERSFCFYEKIADGVAYLLTTYVDDGDPPPSSNAEPVRLAANAKSIEEFRDSLWNCIDNDNKISLFAEEIDLDTESSKLSYINKFERIN